jgi:hypothetical protein
MQDTEEEICRLVEEWRSQGRPLFLVDEIRDHDAELGEIVSFILLLVNSQLATRFADNASRLRELMPAADGQALIKGASLYGDRRRPFHDELRCHIRAVVERSSVVRYTTSSQVLTRYNALAPGGIRPVVNEGAAPMAPIRGRELVPLMNALKVAALRYGLGAVQVDVLLDRSAQLGLDHGRLGQPKENGWLLGPGGLNEHDGRPAACQCPSRFLFVAPPQRGPFRDLLLLPDAVAYATWKKGRLAAHRDRVAAGEDFPVDFEDGPEVASALDL